MSGLRNQTPIKFLWLPTRVHNALLRWGIRYVEELMGSDPLYFVKAIGPSDHWLAPHTFSDGRTVAYYQHTVREYGLYSMLPVYDPWVEIPRIGPVAIMEILVAIEQWRADNREFERGGTEPWQQTVNSPRQ